MGDGYLVVYDILRDGIGLAPVGVCLGMLAGLGLGIFLFVKLRKEAKPVGCIVVWLLCWAAGTLFGGGNVLFQHFRCAAWARSGNFAVVEGPVTDFQPHTSSHKRESFTVKGQTFEYSDANLSRGGFRYSFGPSGLMHVGAHVRVAHREGRILKLEIRQRAE